MRLDISWLSPPSLARNCEKFPPLYMDPDENSSAANAPSSPSKSKLSTVTSGMQVLLGFPLGLPVGLSLGSPLGLRLGDLLEMIRGLVVGLVLGLVLGL